MSIMNSLEWRAKQLENRLLGGSSGIHSLDSDLRPSVSDQLQQLAALYKSFLDTQEGQKYARYRELYEKHKRLLAELDGPETQVSDSAKAELVLAYEEDLVKHLEDMKTMAEKADKVLDSKAWPDLTTYRERLDKLETITREQHLQATKLDKRTEELIDIYNNIITSFKSNTVIWNQKLEAYEDVDKKMDEDE